MGGGGGDSKENRLINMAFLCDSQKKQSFEAKSPKSAALSQKDNVSDTMGGGGGASKDNPQLLGFSVTVNKKTKF